MTRKKWRIQRTMLVPANWQGTPERFYHFLLGYLMPAVLWQERTCTMEITVRECGPMNPWFSLLRPGTDVERIAPGYMLQRVLTRGQEMQILRGWDDPTRFHRASLDTFATTVLARVPSADRPSTPRRPQVTLLDRQPSLDFYRAVGAETQGGGADWRSIPNIADIAAALTGLGEVSILDTADLDPHQQIAALANTDLLVAQHGAGLSNLVWMPRGSGVVEIKPPLIPTISSIYSNLAGARGLGYRAVDQAGEHASVDVEAVVRSAETIMSDPAACVPTLTGRLPIRILRQLPRRL